MAVIAKNMKIKSALQMYFLYFKAYLCDYMCMLIAKKIEMQVVILQKHNAYAYYI